MNLWNDHISRVKSTLVFVFSVGNRGNRHYALIASGDATIVANKMKYMVFDTAGTLLHRMRVTSERVRFPYPVHKTFVGASCQRDHAT